MSETEKLIYFSTDTPAGMPTGEPATADAAVQRDADALLARLATAETDATALSEEQTQALYRRALQKAGLAQTAAAAENGTAAVQTETAAAKSTVPTVEENAAATDGGTAAPAAPKKTVLWRRWALSAAAALAVIALGSMALVQGGFGVSADTAEQLFTVNSAADMAAPAEAAPEAVLDTVTQYSADFDALPAEEAEEPAAQNGGSSQSEPAYGRLTDAAENTPITDSGTAVTEEAAEEWTDSAGEASPAPDGTQRLLMVGGRLYRATAKTAEPDSDDRTGCIESVIPAGQTPAEDGQANFDAAGAPYVHLPDGLAVLLDGTWVFFEPVE